MLITRTTAAVTEVQDMQKRYAELLQSLTADPAQTLQLLAQDLSQRRLLNPASVAAELASLPVRRKVVHFTCKRTLVCPRRTWMLHASSM